MAIHTVLVASLFVALVLAVVFLSYCVHHRQHRCALPLAVMFTGVAIWVTSELVQIYHSSGSFVGIKQAVRLFGAEVVVIGIVLLGLEYTGRENLITRKMLGLLSVEPIVLIGLILSPYQSLLFETATAAGTPWGYEVVRAPLYAAHLLYSYTLVLVAVGMLLHLMVQSRYSYQRQLLALVVAITIPLLANVSFNIGLTSFDLAPVSFFITATVLMYATFRLRLLDAIPIARRTVLEEMEDMVFVLDERGHITTVNRSALEAFGEKSTLVGEPIEAVLGDVSLGDPGEGDQTVEISVTRGGETRYFSVNRSVLTDYRQTLLAQVLVCRDVTDQRRRKEQLELLGNVQSRFLRHNLRNELSTILSHADLMRREDGPSREESYETIANTIERLVEWGETARTIEQLVEATDRTYCDVSAELAGIVEEMQTQHPDIRFETDLTDEAWILTVPQLESALEQLVDNAARYNTAMDPFVRVTVEVNDTQVHIRIQDNGPGIARSEIEAIESGWETPLEHSSGFGLWLAYWVVARSDGDISFETDSGTVAILTFEWVSHPAN